MPFRPPSSLSSSDSDSHDDSDADTNSLYSLTDSDVAGSFRLVHGRLCTSNSDVYWLPADSEEFARLRSQDYALESIIGRYPPGFAERLQTREDVHKRAMDIGCGSGEWIYQLARDFPDCEAVGIDLVPMTASDMPENCRCEVDDVNLGLEHFYSQYDVVHVRLVASGITDYSALVYHVGRTLRPQGVAFFAEWDYHVRDQNRLPLSAQVSEGGVSSFARFCSAVSNAIQFKGGSIEAAENLRRWCVESRLFDSHSIQETDYWIPLTTSACSSADSSIDITTVETVREVCVSLASAAIPLLLSTGWEGEDATNLVIQAQDELERDDRPLFLRIRSVSVRSCNY